MNLNNQEKRFSIYDKRPLTFPLVFVAVTLLLEGIITIIFADWFHRAKFPVDPTESVTHIGVGVLLLLNLVCGRPLSLLYLFLSFLGSLVFFSYQKMQNPSFRNLTIVYFIYVAVCTAILAMDWLKNRKMEKIEK